MHNFRVYHTRIRVRKPLHTHETVSKQLSFSFVESLRPRRSPKTHPNISFKLGIPPNTTLKFCETCCWDHHHHQLNSYQHSFGSHVCVSLVRMQLRQVKTSQLVKRKEKNKKRSEKWDEGRLAESIFIPLKLIPAVSRQGNLLLPPAAARAGRSQLITAVAVRGTFLTLMFEVFCKF